MEVGTSSPPPSVSPPHPLPSRNRVCVLSVCGSFCRVMPVHLCRFLEPTYKRHHTVFVSRSDFTECNALCVPCSMLEQAAICQGSCRGEGSEFSSRPLFFPRCPTLFGSGSGVLQSMGLQSRTWLTDWTTTTSFCPHSRTHVSLGIYSSFSVSQNVSFAFLSMLSLKFYKTASSLCLCSILSRFFILF